MAYVLGCLFSDGSLENSPYIRGKYIRFASVDLDFIRNIRRLMDSGHTIVKINADGNRKTKYYLRIGSHSIYKDLEGLGLFPNKSLTMAFPEIPSFFVADFVRGYFDGDGSVIIDKYLQKFCNIGRPNFYNSHRSF